MSKLRQGSVDDKMKLKRLHSLMFGTELALEKNDAETALALSLRLAGFLDSECRSDTDSAFINPLIKENLGKIETSLYLLSIQSDRCTFEQASCKDNTIFCNKGNVDLEKIKNSRYFKPLLQNTNSCCKKQVPSHHSGSSNSSFLLQKGISVQSKRMEAHRDGISSANLKGFVQTKITAMYGNDNHQPAEMNQRGKNNCMQSKPYQGIPQKKPVQQSGSYLSKLLNASPASQIYEDDLGYEHNMKRKRRYFEFSKRNEISNSPSTDDDVQEDIAPLGFVTARLKMAMDSMQKKGTTFSPNASPSSALNSSNISGGNGAGPRTAVPKSLGMSRRGVRNNFIPPIRANAGGGGSAASTRIPGNADNSLEESTKKCLEMLMGPDGELPDKLRNLEPRLIEHVSNEIMDQDPNVRWDDIAGLEHAKKCVTEMVIWPLLRPDIFKGCRSPGKGLLLFGPPGTGKTMIGKAIAGEAKATFFYISASSLTSKWIGEGEKLVRALFGVASCRQPAVIFVDEIDSLLSQRKSDGEHESSRRLKTQFLIEMEGFDSGSEQLLLIGATNRPQELDEAARRRLTKRLYIPLPSAEARAWIVKNLLRKDGLLELTDEDIAFVCKITEGYSGSDMKNLVKDASMGPLREALRKGVDITMLKKEDMRSVTRQDFQNSLQEVRPSVSQNELGTYEDWNRQFGSLSL